MIAGFYITKTVRYWDLRQTGTRQLVMQRENTLKFFTTTIGLPVILPWKSLSKSLKTIQVLILLFPAVTTSLHQDRQFIRRPPFFLKSWVNGHAFAFISMVLAPQASPCLKIQNKILSSIPIRLGMLTLYFMYAFLKE